MTAGSAPPLVLVADDDDISRLFIVETLEQAGFKTVAVADGAAALEAAVAQVFDLALLDVDMPHLNGYELCRAVRSSMELKYLPVVMITGHDDAASITQAYEAGATDFIAKPVNWTLLPHRLRYILRNADADRRLRHLAYHDPLTGLPNSQALPALVTIAISRAESAGCCEGVALLQIGVQACGRIRSVFGLDAGDAALQAFAERLALSVAAAYRDADRTSIARIDGDRFVVCLRDRFICERAIALAERLVTALDMPVSCGEHQFFLPPTIGIAISPDHGSEPTALITHAAAANLHGLQTDARGCVLYSTGIGDRARERLALEAALREAVRKEQLTLYFQPKIRLSDGSLVGVEALLRWFSPELGEVTPDRFIPLAEESGLILDIGRWVSQAACRQLMNWRNQGLETTIAINLSARQFVHDDPAAIIQAAALAAAIDPRSIVVEITESALIGDFAGVQAGLQAVRALGCRVAVDDFGTGYSSLAYLKGLPVDELKIDRSFIRNLGSDRVDAAICTAILSLAREVGLNVTAEGVETQAQLDWLRDHECNEAQGYLIAQPTPAQPILARYGNPEHAERGSARSTRGAA
ncbi:MAG: EAL domain-containing protein [Steroidobacteraceae bacterium]